MQTRIALYFFFSLSAGVTGWMLGMVWYKHFPVLQPLDSFPALLAQLPASYVEALNFWVPITDFYHHVGWLGVWFTVSTLAMIVAEKFLFGGVNTRHYRIFLVASIVAIMMMALVFTSDAFEATVMAAILLTHMMVVVTSHWKKNSEEQVAPQTVT